jgi:methylmalonyl-CoA mutase
LTADSPLLLGGEFPPPTREEWLAGVDRVLAKGKNDLGRDVLDGRFQRELVTRLYDGIDVEPLYTRGDNPPIDGRLPGLAPFIRGGTVLGGARGGWDVRQAIEVAAAGGGAAVVLEQLGGGCSSLLLRTAAPSLLKSGVSADELAELLAGVYLELVTVSIDASLGADAPAALLSLWDRQGVERATVRGVLGIDPVGALASSGESDELDKALRAMSTIATRCASTYPNARAVVVDATRYHDAGCSDTEELGCAIATGIAYVRRLVEDGLSLVEAFGQIEFRLAATCDQFLTVAKLRAGRLLWWRVADACGVSAAGAQRQHVVASRAMLTLYDPWVNLLRGTIACFAAGVGGADAITIEPYDYAIDPLAGSELGRRMARNTQIVLIEESHAARVVDPAGGSWYVESLTRSVAAQSWAFMQEIESVGGVVAALASGLIGERIEETWARRLANLSVRRDTITGVSDFPDINETLPSRPRPATTSDRGLPIRRYAAPFEALRERTAAYGRQHGEPPQVLLVNLGRPADFTARATYAKSFFETAGVGVTMVEMVKADEALRIDNGRFRVACICSSDALYAERGAGVVTQLTSAGMERLYVAGRRSEALEEMAAGVDEFIGVGCDVLAALERVLTVLGVQ